MTNWPENFTTSNNQDSLCLINSHAVLQVQGDDAVKFLQGQCTADIESLKGGEFQTGAICNVKGRIVCSFFALKHEDSIFLVMPADLVSVTADYLKKYAAFFKADLIPWRHPCIAANPKNLSEKPVIKGSLKLADTHFHLGLFNQQQAEQLIDKLATGTLELCHERIWLDLLLKSGWVVLGSGQSEQHLPQALNLDISGAVNFEKGCYTGQEIIARMHYRSEAKRRVFLVEFEGLSEEISIPADLNDIAHGKTIGELVNLNYGHNYGLAIMPVGIEDDGELTINGEHVAYKLPAQPFQF